MPGKWIPRRFGEHKAHKGLHKITAADLQTGDILIAKVWGNDAADAAFVRAGQAIFSHVRGGSSQSEHVLLNCDDGRVFTVESLSQGINTSNEVVRRDHVVYSCDDDDLRHEAAHVGKVLSGIATIAPLALDATDSPEIVEAKTFKAYERAYTSDQSTVKYRSVPGMSASVFRTKTQGRFANARLERLHEIVYGGKSAAGVRMICSEFVAACYEVAALQISKQRGINTLPFGSGVDPRGMTAKALEAVLRRSNTRFRLAGRFSGTKPPPQTEQDRLQRLRMAYLTICQDFEGEQVSFEKAYLNIKANKPMWLGVKLDAPDLASWNAAMARLVAQSN